MDLYNCLADYYDEIFPFLDNKKAFFKPWMLADKMKKVLDIGCATGEFAFYAESFAKSVIAIDLDEELLKRAKQKKAKSESQVEYYQMNMLDIGQRFQKQFHLLTCLGNTLVHLQSLQEIKNFMADCQKILLEKGVFIFQIVNYDRIIKQNIKSLPEIDKSQYQFKRYYDYDRDAKLIRFRTELILKESSQSFSNEHFLYPLKWKEINNILSDLGFRAEFFGDFSGSDYTADSPALIAVCFS